MLPKGTKPEYKSKLLQLAISLDAFKSKFDDSATNASAQNVQSGGGSGSSSSSAAARRGQSLSSGQSIKQPSYVTNSTAFIAQNAVKSPQNSVSIAGMEQQDREDAFDEGYKSRIVMIAPGELVLPGYAVSLVNNRVYAARADDVGRRCHGMALRGTGTIGEIIIREGGMCYGLIEGGDSVTKNTLKLSVRPGYLTFADDESPTTKEIYQEVGTFVEWVPPPPGETTPNMCAFSFHYCKPDSLV